MGQVPDVSYQNGAKINSHSGLTVTIDFKPLNKDEVTKFELINESGIWRINSPVNVPHLYPGAITKYLRDLEATEVARKS